MHLNYKKQISEVNRFKRNLLVRLGDFTESIGEADEYIKASLKEHMWERIEMVRQKRRHVTRPSTFHGIW